MWSEGRGWPGKEGAGDPGGQGQPMGVPSLQRGGLVRSRPRRRSCPCPAAGALQWGPTFLLQLCGGPLCAHLVLLGQ